MTKKIFRSFMVSAAAVLLAAVAIVMTCLYSYFASVQENQLQDQLQLAAAAVETQGRDYLNKLTADRYRLTWIAPDGAADPAGRHGAAHFHQPGHRGDAAAGNAAGHSADGGGGPDPVGPAGGPPVPTHHRAPERPGPGAPPGKRHL